MVKRKRRWSWAIFLAGLLLGSLGMWGPVHEGFHALFCWIEGGTITAFEWTFIGTQNAGPLTAYAGHWGETLFLLGITYLLYNKRIRWFPWGSAHWPLLYAPFSEDFGVRARICAGVSETGIWIGRLSWALFALLVLLLGWIAMVFFERGQECQDNYQKFESRTTSR